MNPLISIIIRTKDEERWISHCLKALFSQQYQNFEVILVDNQSKDKTLAKAGEYNIKTVIQCDEYLPGRALNLGIKASEGEYIVCLSGHCIPVNDRWLSNLLRNFAEPKVAGVYGRQEPLAFTPDADKRDLCTIFGLDRKVQRKDSFFHNANSMIPRALWDRFPFDETVTNIEDRVWAHKVLQHGYCLVYEPESSVYHYHGVFQNGDVQRCANTVSIIENLTGDLGNCVPGLSPEEMKIVCLIPLRGKVLSLNGQSLLKYTIDSALESRHISQVIVCPDDPQVAEMAIQLGAEAPFLRDKAFSEDFVDLERVLGHCLDKIEEIGIFPDLLVSMEVTFPFRPPGIADRIIDELISKGYDSVLAGRRENKSIWKKDGGRSSQLSEGLIPRKYKDPVYIGLRGLCCVTHPVTLRMGRLYGDHVGLVEVQSPYAGIEVRSQEDLELAQILVDPWLASRDECVGNSVANNIGKAIIPLR